MEIRFLEKGPTAEPDLIEMAIAALEDDFEAGERILAHGRPAVIVKVNPKTLRARFDLEWMNALNITKVPYDALRARSARRCPEMGLELGAMGLWTYPAKPPEEPYAY